MKKGLFQLIFGAVFIATLTYSCGPNEQELAAEKINEAGKVLTAGDTVSALLHLDSISRLYPTAVNEADKARQFRNRIYQQMIMQRRVAIDSLAGPIAELEKKFVKEKGAIDRYVRYVPKRQTFKRSWDRSFIQVHLDERGEIYLSSNYYGETALNHTGIRVYDGKDQAKSGKVELDDVNNHRSDFMEGKWEKVTYLNGKSDSVMAFIANNTERKLKTVFLGKRYYYIVLETFDKEAVRDAWNLSLLLKRRWKLSKEVENLQRKLKS